MRTAFIAVLLVCGNLWPCTNVLGQRNVVSGLEKSELDFLSYRAGQWVAQIFADYTIDPVGTEQVVHTLSKSSQWLLTEMKSFKDWGTGPTGWWAEIIRADTNRHALVRYSCMGKFNRVPIFNIFPGMIGANGDVVWKVDGKPVDLWHRINHDEYERYYLPEEVRADPFNIRRAKLIRRYHRSREPLVQAQWPEGKEGEIMSRLAGVWNVLQSDESRIGSKTNQVSFTATATGQQMFVEWSGCSNAVQVLIAHPPQRKLVWLQILEDANPDKPELTVLVGQVGAKEDTVLWSLKDDPSELWQLQGNDRIIRLLPDKKNPFNVESAKRTALWTRIKQEKPDHVLANNKVNDGQN